MLENQTIYSESKNCSVYSYLSIRLLIAAMHYNHNSSRKQAVTKKGQLQWKKSHPRGRGGEAVVSPILTPIDYGKLSKWITFKLKGTTTPKWIMTPRAKHNHPLDAQQLGAIVYVSLAISLLTFNLTKKQMKPKLKHWCWPINNYIIFAFFRVCTRIDQGSGTSAWGLSNVCSNTRPHHGTNKKYTSTCVLKISESSQNGTCGEVSILLCI